MSTEDICNICEVGYSYTTGNERRFHRGDYIQHQSLELFVQAHSRLNTFCSAYCYSSNEVDEALLYGDFYLDLDDEDDFEKVRQDVKSIMSYFKIIYKIPPEQMMLYFSGKKGVHIIIPADLLGAEPSTELNGVYKVIAQSARAYTPNKTVDMKIYDKRRLFRIPNTIHGDTGLYKIRLTPEELTMLSIEQIKSLAKSPRNNTPAWHDINHTAREAFQKAITEYNAFSNEHKKDKRFKNTINFIPPCIQTILNEGAQVGQRNITIACLTGFYKAFGKSLNETIDLISEWNSRNTSPTGMSELKRTVYSMFTSEKMFGCATLKTITQCDAKNCKIGARNGNDITGKESNNKDKESQGRRIAPYKR